MFDRLGALQPFDTVRARVQTSGRGRLTRTWFSGRADENLAFSMIVPVNTIGPGEISARVGYALWQVLVRHTTVRIRWPNDIVCRGKKLAGVLIAADARLPQLAVVGVGVNVNCADFPEPLGETATSLALSAGKPLAVQRLWLEIWQGIRRAFSQHEERLSSEFIRNYNSVAWQYITRADVDTEPLQFQTLLADGRALCLSSGGPITLDMAV